MIRIKWYHYYIALATFDVLVIIGSLVLNHRTLGRFSDLLNRAAVIDAQQRDATALGLRLVALNAPGNRVFETREVSAERIRYQRLRSDMDIQRRTGHIEPGDLSTFWAEVDRMCATEERIFEWMDRAVSTRDPVPHAEALVEAGKAMSAMDAHQAQALKLLGRRHEATMNQTASMLMNHQKILLWHGQFELVFVGALILVLIGIFWFFVKLQKADASLAVERRERLAIIGELCSSVAHGIQNPLSAIRSSAELIVDLGQVDGDSRRRAENVLTVCNQLSQRVTRLLKFARTDERFPTRLDVSDAIRAAYGEMQVAFDAKGIALEMLGESGCLVRADAAEFATILIELLSNALDHSSAGEIVTASCRKDGRQVMIDIRDRGPGVPAQTAPHIFDLFFTTKEQGTGIGLASVKRTVESLGGRIELVSPPPGERGTIFRVTLPTTN
jgi:signal transduction histidine kinase